MTQNDQVLNMLRVGWVCATEFLDEHLPRHGARIFELKQAGHLIERRLCQRGIHQHQSRQYEWRLTSEVVEFDPVGQGAWAVSA